MSSFLPRALVKKIMRLALDRPGPVVVNVVVGGPINAAKLAAEIRRAITAHPAGIGAGSGG